MEPESVTNFFMSSSIEQKCSLRQKCSTSCLKLHLKSDRLPEYQVPENYISSGMLIPAESFLQYRSHIPIVQIQGYCPEKP